MIPTISVVIPVYNVEKYLDKCLSSVLVQTFSDFEVIIVDDESPDSSVDIAQTYCERDSRFSVISQANLGLGGARNTGISAATGEYIFLLDSDDYIKEDTFEVLISYSCAHDLDIVVFNYEKVDDDGRVLGAPEFGGGNYTKEECFKRILSLETSPQAWNKMYKRRLFSENRVRYPENFLHEDLPVTYQLFWFADKIGYLNDSYYFWLVRAGSITRQFTFKHINDIACALTDSKVFLQNASIYDEYEAEHVIGCIKMINIMLERCIEHENVSFMSYVLYLIDSESIVSGVQIDSIRDRDMSVYTKLVSLKRDISQRIQYSEDLQNGAVSKLRKKMHVIDMAANRIKNKGMKLILNSSYILMPLDSKRRNIVKKILGKA